MTDLGILANVAQAIAGIIAVICSLLEFFNQLIERKRNYESKTVSKQR